MPARFVPEMSRDAKFGRPSTRQASILFGSAYCVGLWLLMSKCLKRNEIRVCDKHPSELTQVLKIAATTAYCLYSLQRFDFCYGFHSLVEVGDVVQHQRREERQVPQEGEVAQALAVSGAREVQVGQPGELLGGVARCQSWQLLSFFTTKRTKRLVFIPPTLGFWLIAEYCRKVLSQNR